MRILIAKSHEQRDLTVKVNELFAEVMEAKGNASDSTSRTLLIGGTHGDERATVNLLESFTEDYLISKRLNSPIAIISLLNPDGYARNSRYNGRGIDLNRNFPHLWRANSLEPSGEAPLSEPESAALYDFILKYRPSNIVSLHWALAELDADGHQSTGLAESMWMALTEKERLSYRLRLPSPQSNLNSDCSGSLGQWCGHGLVYPDGLKPAIVTLELPYHPHAPRPRELPEDHVLTVQRNWETNSQQYLEAVKGPVHKMLQAACVFNGNIEPGRTK
jgi:Zinc carboxypeptidase